METFCNSCGSKRLLRISGHCVDCFNMDEVNGNASYSGYVPDKIGIDESGDDIGFTYCLNCGKIQGEFPVPQEDVESAFRGGHEEEVDI